jgi:hypothetical protein
VVTEKCKTSFTILHPSLNSGPHCQDASPEIKCCSVGHQRRHAVCKNEDLARISPNPIIIYAIQFVLPLRFHGRPSILAPTRGPWVQRYSGSITLFPNHFSSTSIYPPPRCLKILTKSRIGFKTPYTHTMTATSLKFRTLAREFDVPYGRLGGRIHDRDSRSTRASPDRLLDASQG